MPISRLERSFDLPTFDALSPDDLLSLARAIKVAYYPAGAIILHEPDADITDLWVIRTGQVDVVDRQQVIDVLKVGDAFGPTTTALRLGASVRAAEDTVCYRLPDPRTVVKDRNRIRFAPLKSMISRPRLRETNILAAGQQPVERHMRPVLWCTPHESIASAATRITASETSFVLVDLGSGRTAIATDRDFRSQVATGRAGVDAAITTIAVGPVQAISRRTSVASALLRMVEAGVHHLAVTDDNGAPIGVVRAIDLGSVDVRDPLLIRAAIDSAADLDALAKAADLLRPTLTELHANDVPALRIAQLQTAIVEAIIRRVLALSDTFAVRPDISWLVLGSLARREPLPSSDVDTALLWNGPLGDEEAGNLRTSAGEVLSQLERCGLRRCPDGANADNPLFSRSRSAWNASAQHWITDSTLQGALLLSSIIADSRSLSDPAPSRMLTGPLQATTQSLEFRDAQLRFATAISPPTGFVRDFVVERNGQHRGGLDLKRGGLRPITSLARWLTIVLGDVQGGTLDRINRAAAAGLLTNNEADSLTHAFEDIFELAFETEINALAADRPASTWIKPEALDTLTRRQLRDSFREVAAIQNAVTNHWRNRLSA